MNELVSVIVLTWNRRAMLQETIDTILGQTYRDLELLVIDNGSTDGTQEYVEGINDDRIKYFRNANNGILSVNRNFGIKQAKGSYIAFCDDDDLWMPDKLEKQIRQVEKDARLMLVCTNGTYFDEHGDIDIFVKNRESSELVLSDFLQARSDVMMPSVLINKDVFSIVGFYNEDPQIVTTEDFEFVVRLAANSIPIYFINEPLVRYRVHSVMTSHRNTLKTIAKEKLFFKNLYDKNILTSMEYRIVHRNLIKKHTIAFFKEIFKKSKIVKKAVYMLRRIRHRASTEMI